MDAPRDEHSARCRRATAGTPVSGRRCRPSLDLVPASARATTRRKTCSSIHCRQRPKEDCSPSYIVIVGLDTRRERRLTSSKQTIPSRRVRGNCERPTRPLPTRLLIYWSAGLLRTRRRIRLHWLAMTDHQTDFAINSHARRPRTRASLARGRASTCARAAFLRTFHRDWRPRGRRWALRGVDRERV